MFRTSIQIIIIIIALVIIVEVSLSEKNCEHFAGQCRAQETCSQCIQTHHCCNWCYDENFTGPRCNLMKKLNCTGDKIIENSKASWSATNDNKPFTNEYDSNNSKNLVQMVPQTINVKLRKDDPINVTIEYQAAKNAPLDLYYLMDLTWSMKGDLNTTIQLGMDLTHLLYNLTQNQHIAFGSYVDKKTMPFYLTDPTNYKNPCRLIGKTCASGYAFKHKLNFTKDSQKFVDELQLQRDSVSGNVDNLEGGLEALMQILLCTSELGWRQDSRKFVLITTESAMHLAGDGILAGAVKRNGQDCMIDERGDFLNSLVFDYPSMEEINRQLVKRKINVIFAAKKQSIGYYKALRKESRESTFVAELEEDSTNILEIIKNGYYDFMKRVKLTANTSSINDLEVEFFADCYGNGNYNKTTTCWNVEEGVPIKFKVQLLLKKIQENKSDKIYVEERNLLDNVEINLEYLDSKCQCPQQNSKKCLNGKYVCGKCECSAGWSGETCESPCRSNINSCRYKDEDNIIQRSCFGQGDCVCGKCQCYVPFSGEYCNYRCPVTKQTKLICGGLTHGTCDEGHCVCEPMYTGEDCSCSLSQESCKIPGKDNICNDRGVCKCNQCHCENGYEGNFCEICRNCNGLCNVYLHCVADFIHNKTDTCLSAKVSMQYSETYQSNSSPECYYRYYNKNEEGCEVQYSYSIAKGGVVRLHIKRPRCSAPIRASVAAFWVIGSILAIGLLCLLVWRVFAWYQDKIEYQKFEKETKTYNQHREDNPLYKSPITLYKNPIEMHNKTK